MKQFYLGIAIVSASLMCTHLLAANEGDFYYRCKGTQDKVEIEIKTSRSKNETEGAFRFEEKVGGNYPTQIVWIGKLPEASSGKLTETGGDLVALAHAVSNSNFFSFSTSYLGKLIVDKDAKKARIESPRADPTKWPAELTCEEGYFPK